jgi:hypothetical protein
MKFGRKTAAVMPERARGPDWGKSCRLRMELALPASALQPRIACCTFCKLANLAQARRLNERSASSTKDSQPTLDHIALLATPRG